MTARYNEGKAIDAVMRRIEARDQAVRCGDGWSPDDRNDPDTLRRVDYVCTIGVTKHAFEHTGIEPFRDQIAMEVHNRALFDPIVTRFSNRADRELWELHVPVEATKCRTRGDIQRIQETLISWIDYNASRFPVTLLYDRYSTPHLAETVPGVPFPVSLHRGSLDSPHFPAESPLCGQFTMKYFVACELEQARADRLRKACEDKLPKLAAWKREGARTVLVLEENDLQLTNHWRIGDALASAMAEMPNMVDDVFVVSTGIDGKWWAICLWRDGGACDDPERSCEIDPTALTRLTRR